jgi:hypothetical protein
MSALGQKQTFAPQKAMSALPPIATAKADCRKTVMSALHPKADMCGATAHVCFGPIADIRYRDMSAPRAQKIRPVPGKNQELLQDCLPAVG